MGFPYSIPLYGNFVGPRYPDTTQDAVAAFMVEPIDEFDAIAKAHDQDIAIMSEHAADRRFIRHLHALNRTNPIWQSIGAERLFRLKYALNL